MPGPMHGVRVIDLTSMISGPLATLTLADQGADVIKVEAPGGGDFGRHLATRRGGFSASFVNNNRNKNDLVYPGHVFPLMAWDGGVLVRAGHTEAAVDISKLAKKNKVGFLALEYSGHGKSSGKFIDGNISKWTKETTQIIKKIV